MPRIAFAIAVLKGARTELILGVRPRARLKVLQYIFGERPESVPDGKTINRIVQLEQFFNEGKAEAAGRSLPQLLQRGVPDPISGCLAAALALGTDPEQFAKIATQMIPHYDALADSHVIEASRLEAAGVSGPGSAAGKGYTKALERGLPVTRFWLERLAAGITRHGLKGEPALRALDAWRACLPDIPWTAWPPKAVESGKVISFK